jgi:hypothetical protein
MTDAIGERRDARSSDRLTRDVVVLGLVFVLGAIMTVLDLTIVNVAVPTIGRELGTSISAIQWVMTGYMLAFASVIPACPDGRRTTGSLDWASRRVTCVGCSRPTSASPRTGWRARRGCISRGGCSTTPT